MHKVNLELSIGYTMKKLYESHEFGEKSFNSCTYI